MTVDRNVTSTDEEGQDCDEKKEKQFYHHKFKVGFNDLKLIECFSFKNKFEIQFKKSLCMELKNVKIIQVKVSKS